MTKKKKDFDFAAYQTQVVNGLMQDKGLLGEDRLLKPRRCTTSKAESLNYIMKT